jgi:hypothetical protein
LSLQLAQVNNPIPHLSKSSVPSTAIAPIAANEVFFATPNPMAPVQINEVKGNPRENRTATHSHIKGLGLRTSDGVAEPSAAGFIGQAAAREVRKVPERVGADG